MFRPAISNKLLPVFPILVLLLTGSGCKGKFFNKTYLNNRLNSTLVQIRVTLDVEGAGSTFPPMDPEDGWYGGNEPAKNSLGNDRFELSWTVNVSSGQTVHIGGTFKNRHKVIPKFVEFWWQDTAYLRVPIADIRIEARSAFDLVLEVENSSDKSLALTVEQLQWTVYPEAVPLDNLVWGDPFLESLPWENVTDDLPLPLEPGGPPLVFDIPDSAIIGYDFGLVRAIVSIPDSSVTREAVYQTPLDSYVVPSLAQLALIILAMLLLVIAAWMLRKRKMGTTPV